MKHNFNDNTKQYSKLGDTRDFGNFYELIHSRKQKILTFLNMDLTKITTPDFRPFTNFEHAYDTLISYHIFYPWLYEDLMFFCCDDVYKNGFDDEVEMIVKEFNLLRNLESFGDFRSFEYLNCGNSKVESMEINKDGINNINKDGFKDLNCDGDSKMESMDFNQYGFKDPNCDGNSKMESMDLNKNGFNNLNEDITNEIIKETPKQYKKQPTHTYDSIACELLIYYEQKKLKGEVEEEVPVKKKGKMTRRNMVLRLKTSQDLVDRSKGLQIRDYKFVFTFNLSDKCNDGNSVKRICRKDDNERYDVDDNFKKDGDYLGSCNDGTRDLNDYNHDNSDTDKREKRERIEIKNEECENIEIADETSKRLKPNDENKYE